MIPIFKDLVTGAVEQGRERAVDYWQEGNGSCDCNRAIAFGVEVDDEMARSRKRGICWGSHRFVVVAVRGDLEGYTANEAIAMANETYTYSDAASP